MEYVINNARCATMLLHTVQHCCWQMLPRVWGPHCWGWKDGQDRVRQLTTLQRVVGQATSGITTNAQQSTRPCPQPHPCARLQGKEEEEEEEARMKRWSGWIKRQGSCNSECLHLYTPLEQVTQLTANPVLSKEGEKEEGGEGGRVKEAHRNAASCPAD